MPAVPVRKGTWRPEEPERRKTEKWTNISDAGGAGTQGAGPLLDQCRILEDSAAACHKDKRYSQAIPLLEKALEIRTEILKAEKTKETIRAFTNTCRLLADSHELAGDCERARCCYVKGMSLLSEEKIPAADPAAMAGYLRLMAAFYERRGMGDKAEAYYEKALDLLRRNLNGSSDIAAAFAGICMDYADIFYYGHHDVKKARELLEEGIRACEGHAGIKLTQVVMENRLRSWK